MPVPGVHSLCGVATRCVAVQRVLAIILVPGAHSQCRVVTRTFAGNRFQKQNIPRVFGFVHFRSKRCQVVNGKGRLAANLTSAVAEQASTSLSLIVTAGAPRENVGAFFTQCDDSSRVPPPPQEIRRCSRRIVLCAMRILSVFPKKMLVRVWECVLCSLLKSRHLTSWAWILMIVAVH